MQGGMKRMKCDWINNEIYSNLKGKTILVAGGTGFIGKRAVEIFEMLGMKVSVLSRKHYENKGSIEYAIADLNDISSLEKAFAKDDFDFAVYMAANIPLQGSKKEDYYDAKISTFDPFINFCKVFLERCGKFVYISSVDVVGGCATMGYDEDAKINVATPYGLAKYIGEFYTKDICFTNNIPYAILRFSQVYGPNEPVVRIIPIIKQRMKNGEKFSLFTDGNELRRFLYIDDAVKGIVNAIIFSDGGIYNIAGPDTISMKDLVNLIESTWNIEIDLEIKGQVNGLSNVPSIKKAETEIKFVPDIGIKEGLKIVMEVEKC